MLNILLTISPVFILIGLGYFAFKRELIKAEAMPSLGNIVLYLAIPAVMIGGLSKIHISEIVEPYFLLAYGLGSLLNLLVAIVLTLKLKGNPFTQSAIQSMGMSIPNSMFVGFPVLSLSLGLPEIASLSLMMAVLIENILILPIVLMLLEYSVGHKSNSANILRAVALRIVKNPLIISIAMGVAISLVGIALPKPITQSLDLLTKISAGLALLFIGAALANIKPQEKQPWADISLVMLGKLILHPALVALCVFLLPNFNQNFQQAVIIIAAAPMMSIYPILGERYGLRDFCASTLFMTTLVSFISISIVLLLLGR
ncbi:AEC family transporter [uncultured Thiothrix sp.]|uniref:AEC family transporter n=1 Tax=uncultured Thiothrix sp. TaxID=223185 RepID=UPI00260DABA5|nr:AEC family transporter [uncultured Thiothrix sp.]